jgi:hypothetical protein
VDTSLYLQFHGRFRHFCDLGMRLVQIVYDIAGLAACTQSAYEKASYVFSPSQQPSQTQRQSLN